VSDAAPPTFDDLKARAEAWTAPIPGASPAGAAAKFDPAYEAVQKEVAKLDSPMAVPVDWALVLDQGGGLLKKTSKDLLLSVYVANGLYATKRLPGLVTGFVLVTDMMERYWPTMFPEVTRLKARGNAMSWLVDRVMVPLGTQQVTADDRAEVEALQVAAKKLADVARQNLGSAGPAFGPLLEAIERIKMSLPAEAPPPPPPPPPTAQPAAADASAAPAAAGSPAPAAAPTFEAPAAPAAGADPTEFLRNVGSTLVSAAGPLRAASTADPIPYRILRVGLYMHVNAPPPVAAGKTRIPPLSPAVRTKLDQMSGNGKWAAVIDEAESALNQARFCLDLHRYTAQALAGLGDSHQAALQAVLGEVAVLLRRLPDLPSLFAADGSPLCSSDTRTWMDSEVGAAAGGGGHGGGGAGAGSNGASGGDAAKMAEARKLAAAGKLAEALALSQAAVAAAPTGLARFTTRLDMAELASGAGQPGLARAIYEDLDREMGQRGLESWDPKLAARCLEGLLKVLRVAAKSGAKGGVEQNAVGVIYDRLCRLDPAAVLRLGA
jgi:type VI secretion system protein VasJ